MILLLLLAAPTFAASYTPYAWTDANLALIYPASWSAPVATAGDNSALTLTLTSGDTTITLTILPAATDDASIRPALEAQAAVLNQLPLQYTNEAMYGHGGLHIDTVSADRQQVGIARSGRLPNERVLLVASRSAQANQSVLEADLAAILDSIVFSASVPPMMPSYHLLWSTPATHHAISGLAVQADHLYTVDTEDGVQVFNTQTGAALGTYPFDHPAAPTALAVDAAGIVYVADTVCRCIRKLNQDGRWFDSVGSFGGGAPFSLAVTPNGTIYATDKTDSGYVLRILGDPRDATVGLNFNASAPPLVTVDGMGQVWVIEWLSSLIDGTTSGAASLVSGAKPQAELQFWLQSLAPQSVTAMTSDRDGDLVFATDKGVLVVNSAGQVINQVSPATLPRVLTFGADSTLYTASADGVLTALSTTGTPDRFGATALVLNVPVQGSLTETAPQQNWTFDGTAGQHVTFSAVDQSISDATTFNLDMALRLIAPDGKEVAYNDDQLGTDLFGVYDSEISDISLPQTGTYTVRVEWRQGQGTYTLGVSSDQALALNANGVTEFDGHLQDVFPVQRWAFSGHRGDVLTFTMSAEGGTLDPALALFKPEGTLIAYNDDANDPELKINAQLTQVHLPVDGTYIIEASRYDGAGSYHIVIVNTG